MASAVLLAVPVRLLNLCYDEVVGLVRTILGKDEPVFTALSKRPKTSSKP